MCRGKKEERLDFTCAGANPGLNLLTAKCVCGGRTNHNNN